MSRIHEKGGSPKPPAQLRELGRRRRPRTLRPTSAPEAPRTLGDKGITAVNSVRDRVLQRLGNDGRRRPDERPSTRKTPTRRSALLRRGVEEIVDEARAGKEGPDIAEGAGKGPEARLLRADPTGRSCLPRRCSLPRELRA